MAASKTLKTTKASWSVLRPEVVTNPEDALRLLVIEESIEVATRVVDRGGYRIAKKVETRAELVDELLRSEQVSIERRAMNTAISDDAIPVMRQEGDTLIVPVIEEVLITVKRLVLVEEVRITRIQTTRRDEQTVTLRKERIEIERLVAEEPSTAKPSQSPTPKG